MAVGNKLSKNNETMSDSMAQSLTNFSKTKENLESYGISKPPMIPQKLRDMNTKKQRKSKLLPSLFDESKISSKRADRLQLSTDVTIRQANRGNRDHTGLLSGYDTEVAQDQN